VHPLVIGLVFDFVSVLSPARASVWPDGIDALFYTKSGFVKENISVKSNSNPIEAEKISTLALRKNFKSINRLDISTYA